MQITLTVENVTPLFIAGADPRHIENEGLRPPSLKGLMRWWFRAIMGGMVSLSDLKKLEREIFGFTDKKASINVISITRSKPSEINVSPQLKYLWFSINMQKRKGQRLCHYAPNSRFEVTIYSSEERCLKIALGCLWALIYVGGIGSRMRRGAGSLKVVKISKDVIYNFIFNGNTINDARNFMEENLKKIFESFRGYAGERYKPQSDPKFAVLSKKHAEIVFVRKPFDKWEQALETISSEYQQFRRRKKLEYRYTFGLPIITHPRFRNLRQGSPLFIAIMDLNGKYALRLVKFYTSIHHDFYPRMNFLEQDLDGLDNRVEQNTELGETMVKIPG